MSQLIPLSKLTVLMSEVTGYESALCQNFVRAMVNVATQALISGDFIRVRGLGFFKVEMHDGNRSIVFIPDERLARKVNPHHVSSATQPHTPTQPQAKKPATEEPMHATPQPPQWKPTNESAKWQQPEPEIDHAKWQPKSEPPKWQPEPEQPKWQQPEPQPEQPKWQPEPQPEQPKWQPEPQPEQPKYQPEPQPEQPKWQPEPQPEQPKWQQPEPQPEQPQWQPETQPEAQPNWQQPEPQPAPEPIAEPNYEYDDYTNRQLPKVSDTKRAIILAVLCLLAGFVLGYLTARMYPPEHEQQQQADAASKAVTVEAKETTDTIEQQAKSEIDLDEATPTVDDEIDNNDMPQKYNESEYDIVKVSKGETLGSIAKNKYGHKEYWVYIYEENKDVIENPFALPIGVNLRVYKDRSKYETGVNEAENIKIAKRKMAQYEQQFQH